MAIWDAAAKIARQPLYRFLARLADGVDPLDGAMPVYASGGYPYPEKDLAHLGDEVRRLLSFGYTRVKIKIGAASLSNDRRRIETALALLPSGDRLAVDAMNAYDGRDSLAAAAELEPYGLWWFEDVCDPLDFDTLAAVAAGYGGPRRDRRSPLLGRGGQTPRPARRAAPRPRCPAIRPRPLLRSPGFLRILKCLEGCGWPRSSFWPHGGHLLALHVTRALGRGGAEVDPLCFQPFGGWRASPPPAAKAADPL